MTFETRVTEEIAEHNWVCDTHGHLPLENIGISVDGQLICELCSAAKIGSPNAEIDVTIEMMEFSDSDVDTVEV